MDKDFEKQEKRIKIVFPNDLDDISRRLETIHLYKEYLNKNIVFPIALHYWNEIPKHFPFVELAAFVIMPNHVHGIIIIDKPVETANLAVSKLAVSKLAVSNATESDIANAEITDRTKQTAVASVKWKPATLGVIINQYKRICTIHARKTHPNFSWQSLYYDTIIRDFESYNRISEYL
jgi:putative transposase